MADSSDRLPSRHVETAVRWRACWSVFVPYQARVGAEVWALRLNDFPAEPMFTLFVDGRAVGSIDDFPAAWTKPGWLGELLRSRLVPWARELAADARRDA